MCLSHLSGLLSVFELRKNKWLSHGQPGYNFWLSAQVFGCPYLEYMYKGDLWQQIYGCSSDNCISIFGCPATFLVVPGARTTKISNAAWMRESQCMLCIELCHKLVVHLYKRLTIMLLIGNSYENFSLQNVGMVKMLSLLRYLKFCESLVFYISIYLWQ